MLASLTHACSLRNDRIIVRLLIHKGLVKIILDEADRNFRNHGQMYLLHLYKAMFAAAYYGMLRIGEVTESDHAVRASNVHIGQNKKKFLFLLKSSKTHNKGNKPQIAKVSSMPVSSYNRSTHQNTDRGRADQYCPFQLIRNFVQNRPPAIHPDEQFFVFRDHTPVKAANARHILKLLITQANLDPSPYQFHGLRSGRSSNLVKLGVSVETIKKLGCWKSNAVFTYLRD